MKPILPLRPLGTTGLQSTLIGFGALEIGRDWGIGGHEQRRTPTEDDARAVLNGVLDSGVNLVDSARAYHRSEERIGKFISQRRSEYILTTKCGEHSNEPNTYYDFSYDAIRGSIELSRKLLNADVIDVLHIHFGPDSHRVLDEGGCVRAMKESRDAGVVKLLGASVNGDVLERCIESGDFQVVQVGYSLLRQEEEERIRKASRRGIGVLIRSGLAGGWLTMRATSAAPEERPRAVEALLKLCDGNATTLTQLALHFLARHEGISSILVGTKSLHNLREAIQLLSLSVDESMLSEAIRIGRELK